MRRIPPQVFLLAAAAFLALAIWSAMDQNLAGLIAGLVLAAVCVIALSRRPSPS